MSNSDWNETEVRLVVTDYFSMLASQFSGLPYSKTVHRRALQALLNSRSEASIEFKHANISAVLVDAGCFYIHGYKPRSNYQKTLVEEVACQWLANPTLRALAAFDADRPITVPDVDDILSILTPSPHPIEERLAVQEASPQNASLRTDYLAREAQNRSLGLAGEEFVLSYERARLVRAGAEKLAGRIEHTSQVRGDHEGYDILSFEPDGSKRLIEVKTTKYGILTPFFVSRNEVQVSERHATQYRLYRMFSFQEGARLYTLPGSIPVSCLLSASTFTALPR